MKVLETMTKDERSLLIYFESRCVDYRGWLDMRQMNKDDEEIAKRWNEEGLIVYKRGTQRDGKGEIVQMTYEVELSPEAWKLAHAERIARAKRMRAAIQERETKYD